MQRDCSVQVVWQFLHTQYFGIYTPLSLPENFQWPLFRLAPSKEIRSIAQDTWEAPLLNEYWRCPQPLHYRAVLYHRQTQWITGPTVIPLTAMEITLLNHLWKRGNYLALPLLIETVCYPADKISTHTGDLQHENWTRNYPCYKGKNSTWRTTRIGRTEPQTGNYQQLLSS